jgi:hypothetical protein
VVAYASHLFSGLPLLLATGLARDVAHQEWQKMCTASESSFELTVEYLLGKFKPTGKTAAVADSILQCRRCFVADTLTATTSTCLYRMPHCDNTYT